MVLTISSFMTTCASVSLFLLLICVFTKKEIIVKQIGPRCLTEIMLIVFFQMLVPFEFSWTKSIWVENILTPIRRVLIHNILIGSYNIMVWHIGIMIWISGVIFVLLYKICFYKRMIRCISLLPKQDWTSFLQLYDLDNKKFDELEKIKLVYCEQFVSPCLLGLRNPVLILPELSFTRKQLYYIILHELMHFQNRDIIWKIIMDLFCMLFWWNPAFYFLRDEYFQLIEIRNDMDIISAFSEYEKLEYMECLKEMFINVKSHPFSFGLTFNGSGISELKRRLRLISNERHIVYWKKLLAYTLTGVFLLLNSAIVIEPFCLDKADEGRMLLPDDMYAIINGEKYDVYVNGQYAITVDDLELFQGIEIKNN